MTYKEAIQALVRAQSATWGDLSIHDGITQAIQVFKRMEMDLETCKESLNQLEEVTQ